MIRISDMLVSAVSTRTFKDSGWATSIDEDT